MYSNAAMLSVVLDDCGRPLPAVRSIELVVCNLRRKSSSVCLFNFVRIYLAGADPRGARGNRLLLTTAGRKIETPGRSKVGFISPIMHQNSHF